MPQSAHASRRQLLRAAYVAPVLVAVRPLAAYAQSGPTTEPPPTTVVEPGQTEQPQPGQPGQPGQPAQPGQPGQPGEPGAPGPDGVDGSDVVAAQPAAPSGTTVLGSSQESDAQTGPSSLPNTGLDVLDYLGLSAAATAAGAAVLRATRDPATAVEPVDGPSD